MEEIAVREEIVNDTLQEIDELSGDSRHEENTSSGESTMTCSTLSSIVSLPNLESLSDSAPDPQQPEDKLEQCCTKRNRRGRRGRKPKQLPKTSRSDDEFLNELELMENMEKYGKRMKLLLPKKVSSDMTRNPNHDNPDSLYSENRFVVDVNETISSLPKMNICEAKKKKRNRGKSTEEKLMILLERSEDSTDENDSDQPKCVKFKYQVLNPQGDSDSDLSDREYSIKDSIESEIAFEKKVSELCKDIKNTKLENRSESNISAVASISAKAANNDIKMLSNLNDIASGSAGDSDLMDCVRPSTSHGHSVNDQASGQGMIDEEGKIARAERRKKTFRKRRDTILPKSFEAVMRKKIMKLTDEIDQIDAMLAKEIEKKDKYYKRGYKITHNILANLKKEKEG